MGSREGAARRDDCGRCADSSRRHRQRERRGGRYSGGWVRFVGAGFSAGRPVRRDPNRAPRPRTSTRPRPTPNGHRHRPTATPPPDSLPTFPDPLSRGLDGPDELTVTCNLARKTLRDHDEFRHRPVGLPPPRTIPRCEKRADDSTDRVHVLSHRRGLVQPPAQSRAFARRRAAQVRERLTADSESLGRYVTVHSVPRCGSLVMCPRRLHTRRIDDSARTSNGPRRSRRRHDDPVTSDREAEGTRCVGGRPFEVAGADGQWARRARRVLPHALPHTRQRPPKGPRYRLNTGAGP